MERNERPRGGTRGWPYIVAGVVFAAIIGWISYTDALFVTRLAGNTGGIAYAYPTIPDGLLFFSLLSAWEAARAGVPRSRWAVAGLALGAGMTLAANVGAGLGHSVLDALIDGLVPVCFFIAVEIVLWHVRHARTPEVTAKETAVPGAVPVTVLEAARASMKATAGAGNPLSVNQLEQRFGLKRAVARDVRAEFVPERGRGGAFPVNPGTAPAAPDSPAGVAPVAPAGAELQAAANGRPHG